MIVVVVATVVVVKVMPAVGVVIERSHKQKHNIVASIRK